MKNPNQILSGFAIRHFDEVFVNYSEQQFGNEPHCMESDRQVFGRVNIRSGGSWIFLRREQH